MGPVYVHVGTEEDVTLGWLVVVAVLVFGTVVYSPSESRADTNPQGVGQRPAQTRAHPRAAIVMGVAAVCIRSAIACSATGYGWLEGDLVAVAIEMALLLRPPGRAAVGRGSP